MLRKVEADDNAGGQFEVIDDQSPMAAFSESPALCSVGVQPPPRANRRRWLRFSLRTLMIAVTLFCIAAGFVSSQASRQKRAVERIKAACRYVAVFYEYQLDAKPNPRPVDPAPPGPDWLRSMIGIDYLATVAFVGVNVATDEFLEAAADLPHLRALRIACDSKISDHAWEKLKGLTELESLYLRGIHDSGMESLRGLSQLQSLYITQTDVTDAGLASLRGLNRLRILELWQTKVTDGGVKDLQRALPHCKIRFYK